MKANKITRCLVCGVYCKASPNSLCAMHVPAPWWASLPLVRDVPWIKRRYF